MASKGWDYTYIADSDLSSYQYRFVKASSTAGNVELNATMGGSCLGVLQNDPTAGEEATVRRFGQTKVRLTAEASNASPLTFGGLVISSSTGLATGYINTTAGCAWCMGQSEVAYASGSGAYGTIFLTIPQRAVV